MKKLITLSMCFIAFSLFAQEEEETEEKKAFSLSGSVDVYYQTNLTSTDRALFGDLP